MEPNNLIKILVVDDHSLVRDGIVSILEHTDNILIAGSCASGEEAIGLVEQYHPHVILMDILLPGMSGIEATRWIKEQNPSIKIILLSMEIKKVLVTAGIQAGIDGYLPKDSHKETMLEAIHQVMQGKTFFTEAITALIFEDYYQHQREGKKRERKMTQGLTKREHEVLELIAHGLPTKEVGERLFISMKTVETHKAHILEKLGLKNTSEIVLFAVKNKIICP